MAEMNDINRYGEDTGRSDFYTKTELTVVPEARILWAHEGTKKVAPFRQNTQLTECIGGKVRKY
jgi:hypothetical protein